MDQEDQQSEPPKAVKPDKMAKPAKPKGNKNFPGQHDGEAVELVFHRHPIVMRKQFIIGMVAILAGSLIVLAAVELAFNLFPVATKIGYIYIPIAVVAYWFYHWVGWYYSVYIVTNERLVEIKQSGFFNRKVTEFGLDKVQNVNYHIKGFQAVIFQFGDITVQTYVGDLVISTVHKPVQIHEQIVNIVRQANVA